MTSINQIRESDMKRALITILLLTSIAFAHEGDDCGDPVGLKEVTSVLKVAKKVEETGNCPNPKKLRGICLFVENKDADSNPQGRYRYLYQRKLLEASCVDLKSDSEELISKKISNLWATQNQLLKCSGAMFDVEKGSLLKFAINSKFDEFLIDAVNWKINLNSIDESDGRTVLDYIEYHIEKDRGKASEPVLRRYYEMLRKAGAKHKKEL
jgi:hypothetical protein